MRAGNLDRVVLIEQSTAIVNDAGTPKKTWTTFATMRAQLLQFDTNDREASRGSATEKVVTFRMRWLDGVTLDHRVTCDGQAFTIRTIKELGRRAGLDVICERVGP